jgi:hypothetical protein
MDPIRPESAAGELVVGIELEGVHLHLLGDAVEGAVVTLVVYNPITCAATR